MTKEGGDDANNDDEDMTKQLDRGDDNQLAQDMKGEENFQREDGVGDTPIILPAPGGTPRETQMPMSPGRKRRVGDVAWETQMPMSPGKKAPTPSREAS